MEAVLTILIIIAIFFGPSIYESLKDKWNENNKPKDSNYNQNRSSYNNSNFTTLAANRTTQTKQSNVDLSDGTLIVDYARDFEEGFAPIRPYKPNDKMFFISKDGKNLLGPYWDIETGFSEGLALVRTSYEEYWYIDKEGNKVLGPYKRGCFPGSYGQFHNGYAIASDSSGKRVLIDREGKEIATGFLDCYNSSDFGQFSEGFIKLKYDDGFYYINNKGEKSFGPYEDGYDFKDGLCPVKIDNKWWYIDNCGVKKLGPYYKAYEFVNGAARVDLEDKIYAIINTNGEYEMEPIDEVEEFGEEPLSIWSDRNVAYITGVHEGFVVIAINGFGKSYISTTKEYDDIHLSEDYGFVSASIFSNGKAIVCDQNNNTYVINKEGKKILNINGEFEVGSDQPFTKDGLVTCFNKDNKYGFMDEQGRMLKVSRDIRNKIFYKENKPEADPMAGVNALVSMFDNVGKTLVLQALKNLHENKGKTDAELMSKIQVKNDPTTFKTYYFITDEESAIHGRVNPDTIDAQIEAANKAYDAREAKRLARTSQVKTEVAQNTPIKTEQKTEQSYHVIGVQFDGYKSGCYYYYGDNKIYNIGDRVLVPTGNNGNQEATVVFRKIYSNKSEIPYGGNLKSVIRKL